MNWHGGLVCAGYTLLVLSTLFTMGAVGAALDGELNGPGEIVVTVLLVLGTVFAWGCVLL